MRMRTYLLLVPATLLVLIGGCGTDSGQGLRPVDTVAPNPPVGIEIGQDDDLVLITWNENAEIDLAGYRLYSSSSEEGPFAQVTSRLLLCPWYYDDSMLPMAVTYYRVTAVDESGNESAFSQVVGIYWNTGGRTGPEQPAGQ